MSDEQQEMAPEDFIRQSWEQESLVRVLGEALGAGAAALIVVSPGGDVAVKSANRDDSVRATRIMDGITDVLETNMRAVLSRVKASEE